MVYLVSIATSGKLPLYFYKIDDVTNAEYKLLHFKQLTIFLQREEGTSF